VRAQGAVIGVFGPTLVQASLAMTLEVATGYDKPTLENDAEAAILRYISALTIGQKLPYSRLAKIAYDTSPGITDVTNVLLNGGIADLLVTGKNVIRASTITATAVDET
jgi:hypothetical protein